MLRQQSLEGPLDKSFVADINIWKGFISFTTSFRCVHRLQRQEKYYIPDFYPSPG